MNFKYRPFATLILGLSIFALLAAKITTDILKIGRGTGEDISIVFDIGSGANNPVVRWNNATTSIQFTNDGTNFFDVGSGSGGGGGTNYVDNSDFEAGIVDGVSATTIDTQENIVTPLFGGRSLQVVSQANVGDVQFSVSGIEAGVIDKRITNLIEIDLRTDNTVADGDWKICLWRTSGTPACVTELTDLAADSEIRHRVPFTPLAGDTYTVKISFTDTTIGRVLDIDRVKFGPDSNSGLINLDGNWESISTGLSNFDGTTSAHKLGAKIFGDSMFLHYSLLSTGAGTAGDLIITVPDSKNIDTTNIISLNSAGGTFGSVYRFDGTNLRVYHPQIFSATEIKFVATDTVTPNTLGKDNLAAGQQFGGIIGPFPIVEQANNKIFLLTQNYLGAVARVRYELTTVAAVTGGNDYDFDTAVYNVGGFTNDGSGLVTIPHDGDYRIASQVFFDTPQPSGGRITIDLNSGTAEISSSDAATAGIDGKIQGLYLEETFSKGDTISVKQVSATSPSQTAAKSYFTISRIQEFGSFDQGGFAQATSSVSGLIPRYQTETKVLDGVFTGSIPVRFERIGQTISITARENTAHPSASTAATSVGFVPVDYRPLVDDAYGVYRNVGTVEAGITVKTDGQIITSYFDAAGAAAANTDTIGKATITFTLH